MRTVIILLDRRRAKMVHGYCSAILYFSRRYHLKHAMYEYTDSSYIKFPSPYDFHNRLYYS
jgi:hypothetical protein